MIRSMNFRSVTAIAGLWFVSSCVAATVTVDVSHTLDVGGPAVKSTLFGVTAFQGFPTVVWDADFRSRLAACRFGSVRFPAILSWCSPEKDDLKWYSTSEAERMFTCLPLFGSRYMYGRFLPILRQWNAQPVPCLEGAPSWMNPDPLLHLPADWEQWGRHCAAYLQLWKRYFPELKYFQVWNEPNANFWKDAKTCARHGGMGGLYADFFNATAKAVKSVHPDLKSIGPVLCWPPAWPPAQKEKEPWYTWQEFTLPFLKRTEQTCDFFDFHTYDIDPDDIIAQASLVYAYTQQHWKRPLLTWITESNYVLHCKPEDWDDLEAEWERRALPYERFLFTLVENQDLFAGNLYHDIFGSGRWCLFNRNGQETGVYGVFWILRNLRGRRIVATSDDAALRAIASVEPERATIVVFNDSSQAKSVTIRGQKPAGHYCVLRRGDLLSAPPTSGASALCTHLSARWESKAESFTITTRIPARATAALYIYPIPAFPQRKITTVRRYFAKELLQFLKGNEATATVHLTLPRKSLPDRADVLLRVGLMRPEEDEIYRIRINGTERGLSAVTLQDIHARGLLREGENTIEVSVHADKPNPPRALASVSAVVIERR